MPHLDPQSVIDYTIVVIAKLTGSIDCFSFFAANRRNSMASPPHLQKILTEYRQRLTEILGNDLDSVLL